MKELRPVQEWSERALKLSKQLITNVSNTFFQVKLIKDNYCFGDLSVQLPNGKIVPWKKISDLDEITEVEFGKGFKKLFIFFLENTYLYLWDEILSLNF